MANLVASLSLLLAMLSAFRFSYRYGLVNRAFYSLSPSIVETSIALPGFDNSSDVPFFDPDLVLQAVGTYLEERLFPEFTEFTLRLSYYDPGSGLLCSSYCQGLTTRLVVALGMGFDYDEQLSFEIKATP